MPNTQPYTLQHVELKTHDGFSLPGLWYVPQKTKNKTAFIFLHGCGSSSVFYKAQKMDIFAQELSRQGISFLAFNNRGAHYIKKLTQDINGKENDIKIGTALEKIADCVPDIEAAIAFVQKHGIENIVLLGESTGANKILVYNHYRPNNPVNGYVCVGGGDDMGLWAQQFGLETWQEILKLCQEKIEQGLGDHLHSTDLKQGIMSYQALYDVLNPDGDYNCFPYTEYFRKEKWSSQPLFHYWSECQKPTLMLYGSEDVFTYVPPEEAVMALQKYQNTTAKVEYQIVKNADHGFHGFEKEEISTAITWWEAHAS